jgi:hypothetical protein
VSIESLCGKETVSVQLEAASTGAEFGVSITPGTASSKDALVQKLTSMESLDYESRGLRVSHVLFFSTDPGVKRAHRVTLSDDTKLEVTGAYTEGRPGTTLMWIVLANSVTTRDR